MKRKSLEATAFRRLVWFVVLAATWHAMAQDAKTPYPNMAPIEQYLMEDRGSEIAMARSAAPESYHAMPRSWF
jgi:hypothetical protein